LRPFRGSAPDRPHWEAHIARHSPNPIDFRDRTFKEREKRGEEKKGRGEKKGEENGRVTYVRE